MSDVGAQRQAILVLGMHRSGTSALARVLNLLGAQLGSHLMPPAPRNNPTGFWEHASVVEIHNKLLKAFGRSWQDVRELPLGWEESEAARTAQSQLIELLQREFGDAQLWAIKDPRMCRLIPLWRRVLKELNVRPMAILQIRHPDEVARSLQVRDGLTMEHSRLLWLQHMANAELHTRDWTRAVVDYSHLLQDWAGTMARMQRALGLKWEVQPEAAKHDIEEFLDPQQRHYEAEHVSADVCPELVLQEYEGLEAIANGGTDWGAVQGVADEYRRSASVFLEVIRAACDTQIEETHKAAAEFQKQRDSLLAALREVAANAALSRQFGQPSADGGRLAYPDTAVLYYRENTGNYDQSRVEVLPHDGMRKLTRLEFRLPPEARPEYVRFDPSLMPGIFEISSLRISGVPVDNIGDLVLTARQQLLPTPSSSEVRVLAFDDDVQLELDLHARLPPAGVPVVIELLCRRLEVAPALRQVVDSAVQISVPAAVEAAHAQTVSVLRSESDDLRTRLDHLNAAIADINHWQRLTFLQRLRHKLRRAR